ncbi:hypothetical protein B0A52_07866 [Exophiala mesophila]|uniref:Bacteriocin-protection protein, YdeI/OmpD-associated family n=1 Tax=Exophiala mesophila TaxID=212818 RepID=A0A438MVF7_EXOME|nr:hypothetical protein B0A52_07866 [Exophiala mesophila]
MPTRPEPTDRPVLPFATASDFEAFLDREHKTTEGIYVKLAKKASGIPSITPAEAVETALCFGWIDAHGFSLNETYWVVRYQPRRPKSMWSQKNVNTVSRLQEQGRMRPAGLAAVEAAKADGRWDRAYAGAATMTAPDDLLAALAASPAAAAKFETLGKQDRFVLLQRLHTGLPKTREKRINNMVNTLAGNKAKSAPVPTKVETEKKPKKNDAVIGASKKRKLDNDQGSGAPLANKSSRRAGLRSQNRD